MPLIAKPDGRMRQRTGVIVTNRDQLPMIAIFEKHFAEYRLINTFASPIGEQYLNICPGGGIGRRAGLKHQWGDPCRFDPGPGYTKVRFPEFSDSGNFSKHTVKYTKTIFYTRSSKYYSKEFILLLADSFFHCYV